MFSKEVLELEPAFIGWRRYLHENPELSDLEQMQLFVIPVTRRFLTTPNRALETELPFAIAQHIPVLPLMVEPGLEALFAQMCGQLQFLDPNTPDRTGIRYEQKLENFLTAVLIGDGLSEQIRSAFDAYIFLSYRKKDRLYARKLMEMIHQNDFCRDIAIWYDEFLTPGENFNASIQAALEKSKLFVMAVTPNLVSEPNYVMTTEYPMARQAGKPILPVALVATDRASLAEKYAGIPAVADDPAALAQALAILTRGLPLRRKDSADQSYLMGLAYLSGVDVEVDHARALALLTEAAEAGLPQAIQKLVDMYRAGMGVARSYETALRWQARLVALREQQHRLESTPTSLYRLALALQELGNQYVGLRQLPMAIEQQRRAAALLEAFPNCAAYPKLHRALAVSYLLLGHFYRETESPETAEAFFEKALPILERLNKKPSPLSRSDLHQCLLALGDLQTQLGNREAAQRHYKYASNLGLFAAVFDSDTVGAGRLMHADTFRKAEQCRACGNLEEAERLLLKLLPQQQRLAEETRRRNDQGLLSDILLALAGLRKQQQDLPGAEGYYLQCLAAQSHLAEQYDDTESRGNLANVHMLLGRLRIARGNPIEARKAFEQALALYKRLAEESDAYQTQFAGCCFRLGELLRIGKRWEQSEACLQKALDLYAELGDTENITQARRAMAFCLFGRACQCKQAKEAPQAMDYFQKALAVNRLLPPSLETDRAIASCHEQIGSMRHTEGQIELTRKNYEAAFSIRVRLAKDHSGILLQEELGRSYFQMFTVTKDRAYLEKAIEIYAMLCRVCPDATRHRQTLSMLKSKLS